MIEQNDAAKLNRRTALGLGATALAAASLPAAAATPKKRLLDPANAADASLIYRKLRYRTDDGLVFSWIKGPYMAATGGDLIPVYAINLGSIQRITHNADGSFELIDLEISFRVDIDTGRRLTDLRNPITGETVKVGGRGPIPTRVRVSATNEIDIPDVPGTPRFEHVHTPAVPFTLRTGEIAVRDRSHARVTAPDGSVSYLNEVSTLSAPSALVLDPAVTNVDTRVQSNDVRSWPEWLRMGDRPGTLNLFGNGGKVKRFEDLPADWHAMLETYYPQIAKDPIAALDKAG
ncbi:DUF1838 family protein [Novosphingobium resinovorum]|uniref:DUF1838 domain-containing protein n=1 Tax=Novosphingobium resinovorum TaxID=158500 RepID=A0A1D8A4A9_9SPHN|nr:DUF1838 family protein [Novosphingobium resinovorum]AOR76947.1 DUF1838 domain-containing protein [Novosphingobium resinovorum]